MTASHNHHLMQLFDHAVELGPDEQAAFLARIGDRDAGLRQRLAALLAADRAAADDRRDMAGIAGGQRSHFAVLPRPGGAAAIPLARGSNGARGTLEYGLQTPSRRVPPLPLRGNADEKGRRQPASATKTLASAGPRVQAPSPPPPPPAPARQDAAANRGLPAIGQRIRQYEIIRELGRGGMGAVYLARDIKLARRVAIKFLLTHHKGLTERFLIEARATAQCRHDNIVVIHDIDTHSDHLFMVLEYLRGNSLRQVLRAGTLQPQRAVELMLPVAYALKYAHERGIVHRDLKPENIMITDTGAIKVLDFGIVKLLSSRPDDGPGNHSRELQTYSTGLSADRIPELAMTATGMLVGTMPYMSPEQFGAGRVDHRTDLWAVGIMLYEMVAGAHPLAPLSRPALLAVQNLDVAMPSASERMPEIGELGRIIDRCLIKRREDRTTSAAQLICEFEALLPRHQPRAPKQDENPFAGLAAFQESDADRFYGRARDVTGILERLRNQPLVAVVGPSGAGKSSLVRAGVIPALKRSGDSWEAFVVRPGRHPLAALANLLIGLTMQSSTNRRRNGERSSHGERGEPAVDCDAVVEQMRSEPGYIGTQLRTRAHRKLRRVLVFVDQFEELYTLGASAGERAAFVRCLGGIADDAASPVRVILSLRSDFLDYVAEDRAFMVEVTRGLFLLPPMGRTGLHEALTRPIENAGYRFENADLVEDMLDALQATPGALPILQFAAAKLWEARDTRTRLLTRKSYEAMGGVAGTLASHADAVLASMTCDNLAIARAVLERLVTPERTRAIASLNELRQLPGDPDQIDRVVRHLAEFRLLTLETGETRDSSSVELIHESLIEGWPTLVRWLDENRGDAEFLARLRTAAKQWESSRRADGLLWRGEPAREARAWRSRYQGGLTDSEQAYLDAVLDLAERTVRRRRALLAGAFALLAALLVAASIALVWIRHAEQKASQQAIALAAKTREANETAARAKAEKEAAQAAEHKAEQAKQRAEEATRKARAEAERARAALERARISEAQARVAKSEADRAARKARRASNEARAAESEAEVERGRAEKEAEERRRSQQEKRRLIDRAVGPIKKKL